MFYWWEKTEYLGWGGLFTCQRAMQICIIYHFIKNTSPQRISHLKVMNSTDRNIQLPHDR
jgi:hypothetical protein